MALSAQAETIAAVGSHSVNANHESGAKIGKEELYPVLPIYWRGQLLRAQFEVSRYTSSGDDWSDWRIYLRDARADDGTSYGPSVNITDPMRRAINEAGTPLVRAWLAGTAETEDGSTYATSRARAFRHFIANKMTNNSPSEYSIRYAAEALEMHGDELTASDRATFTEALAHLQRFRSTIDQLD
jgi:hypothetical protein